MRFYFCILIILLLSTTTLHAEETDGMRPQFRSFVNNITCGDIVDKLDQPAVRQDFVLMVGTFISGSNYAKNRDSKMDLRGMLLVTEQFCRQNMDVPVMAALVSLDKTIDRRIELERKSAGSGP